MDTNEWGHGVHISHHQCNRLFGLAILDWFEAKSVNTELAPASGEIRGCDLLGE